MSLYYHIAIQTIQRHGPVSAFGSVGGIETGEIVLIRLQSSR